MPNADADRRRWQRVAFVVFVFCKICVFYHGFARQRDSCSQLFFADEQNRRVRGFCVELVFEGKQTEIYPFGGNVLQTPTHSSKFTHIVCFVRGATVVRVLFGETMLSG